MLDPGNVQGPKRGVCVCVVSLKNIVIIIIFYFFLKDYLLTILTHGRKKKIVNETDMR